LLVLGQVPSEIPTRSNASKTRKYVLVQIMLIKTDMYISLPLLQI
jgi:hypothetical protein